MQLFVLIIATLCMSAWAAPLGKIHTPYESWFGRFSRIDIKQQTERSKEMQLGMLLRIRIRTNVMPQKMPLHIQTHTSETQPKMQSPTQIPTNARLIQRRKRSPIQISISKDIIRGAIDLDGSVEFV